MTRYEETLSKIAPVFHKFITYHEYFLTITGPFTAYLSKAGFHSDISISYPISTNYIKNYINYLYYSGYILMDYKTRTFYPYIILGKTSLYKKSNMFLSIPDVLTNMIINNFSFEKHKIINSLSYRRPPDTYKDLFIAAVGKDTYEAIRRNIK